MNTTQQKVPRNILIIGSNQFGYLTDTYKYCQYLKTAANVTYLGWDYGLPKMPHDGLNVQYIPRKGNKIKRFLTFLKKLNHEIRKPGYDFVFIKYFLGISVIKSRNRNINYNVDIRTNSVKPNKFVRICV